MKKFIVKGNICYSKSLSEIVTVRHGYVVVEDGLSVGVFKKLPLKYKSYKLFDYGDNLIIPGMCDMHLHASQFGFRGTGMDLQLLDWLNESAFPEEAKFKNLRYAEKAYNIFVETIKKGATTRACIFATLHREATLLLMDKLEKSGLVTYVGKVNMDRNSPDYLCEKSYTDAIDDDKLWLDAAKKYVRTKPILTPRFVPSCTDELMQELGKLQKAYNLPVQSHLSENIDEIKWVKELEKDVDYYGGAYLKHGLFGGKNASGDDVRTIMAHCVWSDDKEIETILKNGVYIAHCPASNENVASGIAPVRKYVEKGIKVTLGTDVAGGHSDSMFRAITDTIQLSKMYYRHIDSEKKPITFEEAFYFATRGGGGFFGRVGGFDSGFEFDAVVIDDKVVKTPATLNLRSRLERAVYLGFDVNGIKGKFVRGTKIL